jgi:hypothetical protein
MRSAKGPGARSDAPEEFWRLHSLYARRLRVWYLSAYTPRKYVEAED